jgi:hypothetical protein
MYVQTRRSLNLILFVPAMSSGFAAAALAWAAARQVAAEKRFEKLSQTMIDPSDQTTTNI